MEKYLSTLNVLYEQIKILSEEKQKNIKMSLHIGLDLRYQICSLRNLNGV